MKHLFKTIGHYAARGGFPNAEPPEYSIQEAKKYLKVWMRDGAHRSIHAFIDKKNGFVYKPASVKAPAKGVRYALLTDESREDYVLLEQIGREDISTGELHKLFFP